jgi:protein-disulfide isomerase-like protein with CxxC motif
MKHETWPDTKVQGIVNAKVVPLYLDVDAPASAEPAQRYGVDGIPTLLILGADGRVRQVGGAMTARELERWLTRATTK